MSRIKKHIDNYLEHFFSAVKDPIMTDEQKEQVKEKIHGIIDKAQGRIGRLGRISKMIQGIINEIRGEQSPVEKTREVKVEEK